MLKISNSTTITTYYMRSRRILNKAAAATLAIISTISLLLCCRNTALFCDAGMVIAAPKVFCYGDSLTAGTSPPLNQEFPYAKHLQEKLRTMPGLESSIVRWKGYPGWTSSALLSEGGLPALLDNIHASAGTLDLMIILAGSNDLAYETDSQAILNSITDMHDIALSKGSKTIALGIPPSGWQVQSNSARVLANSVNSQLESWAKENESIFFAPFPIQEFDRSSGFWSPDGLHFSPDGYKKIGESLVPIVADILNRDINK